jgi:hypothetical protein
MVTVTEAKHSAQQDGLIDQVGNMGREFVAYGVDQYNKDQTKRDLVRGGLSAIALAASFPVGVGVIAYSVTKGVGERIEANAVKKARRQLEREQAAQAEAEQAQA